MDQEREHIEELLKQYQHNLQRLQKQAAKFGPQHIPTPLANEIEQTEAQIKEQHLKLAPLTGGPHLNPYRGLSAFREADAPFFFGRETSTHQLLESVRQNPLVAVLGPSGSGKSSIVFAGMIPALRHDESQWLITDFRPGSDPFRSLAAGLLPLYETDLDKTDQMVKVPKLAAYLRDGDLPLSEVVLNIFDAQSQAKRFLLIADQFEELYTLCPQAKHQQQFLDTLLEALSTAPAPFHITLTLRADFLGQALLHPPFGEALRGAIEPLSPMQPDDLQRAIEKPAETQGVTFQEGLTARILAAVSHEPGRLPLLEFALTALWEKQAGGELTHVAYEAVGEVEGALSHHAER
ncbi:MAG: hypothetical protein GY867_01145, partial [bacterium]|nr:hypothetical protein [bacterium]